MTSTLFIQHSDFDQHSVPPQHPESPLRNLAVETKLRQSGLWQELSIEQAKPVSRDVFQLIHSKGYIDQLYNISPPKGMILADPDTPLAFDTLEATEEAAGSGIQAVNAIIAGKHTNAFCAIRPPGHHAEPRKTKGFCFVNNIALAAQHALNQPNIKRVLIFDFDVHQANGTIEAFRGREDVLVVTSFQHPYYPNSHWLVKEDNIINIPIDEYTGSSAYRRKVESTLLNAADHFKPDMVFLSAGFDAHIDDPMGGLELVDDDFYWLTKLSMDIANRYSQGRIVSMMEGGYNLEALGNSAHEHIRALAGK